MSRAMLGIAVLVGGACGAAGPVQPNAVRPAPPSTWSTIDPGPAGTEVPAPAAALPGESAGGGGAVGGRVIRGAPGGPVVTGRIEIPKIGLDSLTYEGNTLATINYGPSHWPGTPMPGHVGNSVFPGHRITHTHPFFFIDELVAGDQIIFTTGEGRFVYAVYQSLIVRPSDMWIVDPTPEAVLTIFGCHPRGSARYRYVVRARLASAPAPAKPAPPPPRQSPPTTRAPAPAPPPASAPPSTTTTTRPSCVICLH